MSANTGWVSVGTDHDTSAFAVATLRNWWDTVGASRYPSARRLLICADGGGSNGSRVRAWKIELARFAADTGLHVTVCHLPPGTSKWNKIEHRLFSQITMNWRGRPLKTHQIIVDLIASTTTSNGLTVQCTLDTGEYPTGIAYTTADVDALPLKRHDFHGEWNYTRQVLQQPFPHGTEEAFQRPRAMDPPLQALLLPQSVHLLAVHLPMLVVAQRGPRTAEAVARASSSYLGVPGCSRCDRNGPAKMLADCVFQTAAAVMISSQNAKRSVISDRHWDALIK